MKKQTYLTIKNGDETETVTCHFQLAQCVQRNGRTSWTAHKTIMGKRKEFTSDAIDHKSAWRDLNQQCHDFLWSEKKVQAKRSTAPTVAEIVVAYFGSNPSSINADHDTRKNNVSALGIVTRGVVSGGEPVIAKKKDGSYELTEPGFWSNLRFGKLTKKVGKDFLDQRFEGYKKG